MRGKRKSIKEDKEHKIITSKKFKKAVLPPIVSKPKSSLLNDRPIRPIMNGQKTFMSAEYTESSTTSWSNSSEKRTFIDTFSFKSQSGRIKRHSPSANNALCYKSVSVKSLKESHGKAKSIKDYHDKKSNFSNSNLEVLCNSNVMSRNQRMNDAKSSSDSSSDIFMFETQICNRI